MALSASTDFELDVTEYIEEVISKAIQHIKNEVEKISW